MKRFLRFLLVLLLLGGLAAGGWYFYTRYQTPEEGDAVYVTSVAEIAGLGYTGLHARYTGVVEARNIVTVNPGKEMEVEECYVRAGDTVYEGTPLFRYDTNSLTLSYEQLLIDISTLENKIAKNETTIESSQKKLERAKQSEKKTLELKIATADLERKKSLFELEDKQAKADSVGKALENSVVCSPCAGRIRSVNDGNTAADPYASAGDAAGEGYVTIISGSEFCVKGTVSEQSVYTLYQGMPVLIRSRLDENDTVAGEIYKIDTDQTVAQQNYYYMGGGGETAGRYAFYVSVPSGHHLIIGQHVLLEAGAAEAAAEGLFMPSCYLQEEDGQHFVYAAGADGRIEKRVVGTGAVREEEGIVEILSGLSAEDAVAFPDESVKPGDMTARAVFGGAEG